MSNRWLTHVDGFIKAVENDEYAELELPNGDTLITDTEGDGVFNPYVELTGEHGDDHPTDILDDVTDAIGRKLDVTVHSVEMDNNNGVVVPYMDRPTNDD